MAMSVQMYRKDVADGFQCDLWASGIMLFFMLFGRK